MHDTVAVECLFAMVPVQAWQPLLPEAALALPREEQVTQPAAVAPVPLPAVFAICVVVPPVQRVFTATGWLVLPQSDAERATHAVHASLPLPTAAVKK